jgi:hypothetical protein
MLQGVAGWHPIAMVNIEAIPHVAARPDTVRQAIRYLLCRDNRATNSAADILARETVIMNRRSAT